MARAQIVRTDAGHHARILGDNGETVWTTEVYTRRAHAVNAIFVFLEWGISRDAPEYVDERPDAHD